VSGDFSQCDGEWLGQDNEEKLYVALRLSKSTLPVNTTACTLESQFILVQTLLAAFPEICLPIFP
jgi:hypothetical protein